MIFTTESELTAVLSADKNSQIGRLRDALVARTFKNTAEPKFVQSGDTQEQFYFGTP